LYLCTPPEITLLLRFYIFAMNNKYPKDANGRPLNGINTSKRSCNLGGNNKRKKENMKRADDEFLMSRAEKERALLEKKKAAEAKLAAKKKAREAARLLDIQMGFVSVQDEEEEDAAGKSSSSVKSARGLTWGSYLARGVI
jgi:hypothetical protein